MAGALDRSASFRGLSEAQLRKLRRAAARRTFAVGDELEPGPLYLLAAGEVTASTPPDGDGVSRLVAHEAPGSLFGGPLVESEALVYRAVEPVDALAWDGGALERLLERDDVLRRQLETRLSLRRRQSELVDLLRRTQLFAHAGQSSVRWLVGSATLARFEPGSVICREGEPGDELFVVVSGEVDVAHEESDSIRKLRRGDFFGEIALVREAPRTATAVAATVAELLVVARREFEVLYRRSPSFREAVRVSAEIRLEGDRSARAEPELVWLVNDTEWPTGHIAALLDEALRAVGEWASSVAPAAHLGRELEGRAGSIVHVSADAAARLPGQSTLLQTVHDVVLGDSSDDALVRPEAFALPTLLEDAPLDEQPEQAQRVFHRLARAVARRRVGVALGGGAAWGLAHVALLKWLERARIPVDMIVGVSAGSLVGAFYASQGVAGLDRLVRARFELAASAFAAVGTTSAVDVFVHRHIPERRLEELPLPFAAVAVEARTGRERIFRHGSLAAAVRASCSLPGVFGRQLGGGERYLDACVRHNVPVSYCTEADADFVIACDVVPPPSPTGGGSGLRRRALELLQVDRLTDTVRSLYWMASTSRDLQAGLADAVFAPNLAEFAPWDFHRADAIAARAEEQLDGWLDATAARYAALCRSPRADG